MLENKITPKLFWSAQDHSWPVGPRSAQVRTTVDSDGNRDSVSIEVFDKYPIPFDFAFEKTRAHWMARAETIADALNEWENSRFAFLRVLRAQRSYLNEIVKYGHLGKDPSFAWFDPTHFRADSPVVREIQDFLLVISDPAYSGDPYWGDSDEEVRMVAQLLCFVVDDLLEIWS